MRCMRCCYWRSSRCCSWCYRMCLPPSSPKAANCIICSPSVWPAGVPDCRTRHSDRRWCGAGRRQAAIGCSADSIRSLGGCLPGGGGTRHRRHGEPAASGLNTPDPLPGFADGLLPAVLARWRGPTRGRVSNNPPRLQDIDRSTPPGTIDSSSWSRPGGPRTHPRGRDGPHRHRQPIAVIEPDPPPDDQLQHPASDPFGTAPANVGLPDGLRSGIALRTVSPSGQSQQPSEGRGSRQTIVG
jgi:hypothetical protein